MIRIVVRLFVRAVLFAIVALPGSVQAQSLPELDAPAAASLPALAQPLNIQVDPLLQPLVDKLLRAVADVTPAVAGHRRQSASFASR